MGWDRRSTAASELPDVAQDAVRKRKRIPVLYGKEAKQGGCLNSFGGGGGVKRMLKCKQGDMNQILVGLGNCEAAPVQLFSSRLWAPVEPWRGFWVGLQCAAPKQLFVTLPAAEAAQAVADESEGKHAFFVLSLDAFAQPLWETASAWQCSNKKARQRKPEC